VTIAADGAGRQKRKRIKLGVRQVRRDLPNFRDHGMTVDRHLLRLIKSLQRQHGYGFASEGGLRAMIHEDTGHLPGVGTICKALVRLERLGYVETRWIHRHSIKPDGGLAEVGMRRLRLAINRGERRAIAARARKVDRREGVDGRYTRAVPGDWKAVQREIARGASQSTAPREQRAAAEAHEQKREALALRNANRTAWEEWCALNADDPRIRAAPGSPGEPSTR